MIRNSSLRARIDRLPPLPRRAARAVLGPGLDLPDDANPDVIVWRLVRQLHLFAPVHAVAFAMLGGVLVRHLPLSAACDPHINQLARITLLVLYEILGVPLLTLAAAYAARNRFLDPYTRHAARIALVLLMSVFAMMAVTAGRSFRAQKPGLRAFGGEILRCAYDGTPPAQIASPR